MQMLKLPVISPKSLISNQGFEELTKKSLLARFIRQFPTIQELVTGDVSEVKDDLIVSQKSFDTRQVEYKELVEVKIPENKEAIATARANMVIYVRMLSTKWPVRIKLR